MLLLLLLYTTLLLYIYCNDAFYHFSASDPFHLRTGYRAERRELLAQLLIIDGVIQVLDVKINTLKPKTHNQDRFIAASLTADVNTDWINVYGPDNG